MADIKRGQTRITRIILSKIILSKETVIGYIQDLSTAGVGITCNRPLPVDTEMKVNLTLPNLPSMELAGAIVWRRKLPDVSRHRFLYGIRLSEPPKNYVQYIESEYERIQGQRAAMRLRYSLLVRGEEILKINEAATEDTSPKGLYIRTRELLDVGKEYTLSIEDEKLATPILCAGKVVSCFECDTRDFEQPYGAGIKIISFAAGDEQRFRDFIRKVQGPEDLSEPDEDSAEP